MGAANPVGGIAVQMPNTDEFWAPRPKSFQACTLKLYRLPVLYMFVFNSWYTVALLVEVISTNHDT